LFRLRDSLPAPLFMTGSAQSSATRQPVSVIANRKLEVSRLLETLEQILSLNTPDGYLH
jgi:hypothetical protein